MTAYICQECNHVSGYHKNLKEYWGSCMIIDCECNKFIWDDEVYEKYVKDKQGEER